MTPDKPPQIAVVIPCYRVRDHILGVIDRIDRQVAMIYVVDDCCPQETGRFIAENCRDNRVRVLFNPENLGVGGAVCTGYRQAMADNQDIVVKIDGDGQMDPGMIPKFIRPIVEGKADYTKGNRFFYLSSLTGMPWIRIFGNGVLSLVSKAASGYWNIMDPTNGFTAIHRKSLDLLPLSSLDRDYFFESDMLFRLGTIRAVVRDIQMDAVYGDEQSNLSIGRAFFRFPLLYARCFAKRIFYNYYLRDFNIASIELLTGSLLLGFGIVFGAYHWHLSATTGQYASTGTVMLATLPVILGVQLLLNALNYDLSNVPSLPLAGMD